MLAEVANAAGDVNRAVALVDEAITTASTAKLPTETAAAQALLGRISFEAGRFAEAQTAYRRALELHDELGSTGRAIEVKAGLAEVLQAQGHASEARALADEVVEYFRNCGAVGINEPVAAFESTHHVLEADGDRHAADLIELARRHLAETANKIANPDVRRSYLNDVAAHRRIAGDDGISA